MLILTNILDFEVDIVNKLSQLNYNPKITQINISNGILLNKGIKMESQNPMNLIYVKKRQFFKRQFYKNSLKIKKR